ncbi:MAG: HipA family kinase [Patescibacteria group bacterium]
MTLPLSQRTDSVCEPEFFGVCGFAKCAQPDMPYIVANEYAANRLASAILLPTPPGFIVEKDSKPYFVSMDFNLAGEALPPIQPDRVVEALPELSAGVIAFDIWVCNRDRHEENLHYDLTTNRLEVFDHSHALLGDGDVDQFLAKKNELAIETHCLAPSLIIMETMVHWIDRIKAIPEYYIREVLADSVSLGFPQGREGQCADMLIDRRRNLVDLIRTDYAVFRSATDAMLFGSTNHD